MKFTGIGSIESGRTTLHANGGYSVGGLARELSYGGAVAVAATDHVTISGELLGRRVDGIGHVVSSAAPTPRLVGVETIRLVPDASSLQVPAGPATLPAGHVVGGRRRSGGSR